MTLKLPSFSDASIANLEQVFVSWCFTISFAVIKKLNSQKALSNTEQCFQHRPLQKQSSVYFKPNAFTAASVFTAFFTTTLLQ